MKASMGNLSFEGLSSLLLRSLFCIMGYNKKLYAENEGNALMNKLARLFLM